MRRFSQRSALVTLSEINITPLLDLAFVLLIIFVITTPLLEQSLPLKMYTGGQPDNKKIQQRDIRTVEISAQGVFALNRHQMTADQIIAQLARDFRANPNLIVYIRADEMGRNKDTYAIIDGCQRAGIGKYSLRCEPPKGQ